MTEMSVREFETNPEQAVSFINAGVDLTLVRDGVIVAEIRSRRRRQDDPVWQAAFSRLREDLDKGVPFGRTFSHDERNG